MSKPSGAHGWPLVPSLAFPGEQTLACPECRSTDVLRTCAYGSGGRLGDPGGTDILRCQACGRASYRAKDALEQLDGLHVAKNQHTPGPWTVHALSNGHDGIVDSNGCTIASVWSAEVDIQGANARLIAQVPAMLALLEHVPHNKMNALHATIGHVYGCPGCEARAILREVEGDK